MAISLSGSLEITGSINATGGITGSFSGTATSASFALVATSASYANNATTSSYALVATSASYALNTTTSSYAANSDLLDGRDSLTFANTGSNAFVGSQNINGSVSITGSLTTTGAITAQTLNVQQVTSSIVYSSGSNIFGNSVSNTQSMTGSVGISGSLAVVGASTFSSSITAGGNSIITGNDRVLELRGSGGGGNSLLRYSDGVTAKFSVGFNNGNYIIYDDVSSVYRLTIAATTGEATITAKAPDADRTLPLNVLTLTAEQGNAPYGGFGGSILFKNRSYTSGLVDSARIRSVIYDDGAPNNFGGGLWFETTPTPGGTLTPSLKISYTGAATFSSSVTVGTDIVLSAANPFVYGGTAVGGVGMSNVGGQSYLKIYGASHATSANVTQFVNAGSTSLSIASTGAATFSGAISGTSATFSGVVTSGTGEGFKNLSYQAGYNRIWSFGSGAEAYGMGYYQGVTAPGGVDCIGFHFGNTATPLFYVNNSGGATFSSTVTASSFVNASGIIRATSATADTTGSGAEIAYSGGIGYFLAYNRGTSTYLPVGINGSTVTISTGASATVALTIASTGQITQSTTISDWSYVMSNSNATSPNGIIIQYTAANKNNTANPFLYCADNSGATLRMEIRSNGGIANYSANDVNLSDERVKKDIEPLESYWDKFKAIEIVKFKYKDQTHDDFNIGVIAQQVEAVSPEFVDVDGWDNKPKLDEEGNEIINDEEPLKSIYTADLYHATIKVLQECMSKIESQQAQIEALKLLIK